MGITYAETGVAYDVHAAMDGALRYSEVDSNVGADLVRKLVKTVKMSEDPDMEEYLARTTEKFCEHMFSVCELIKGIGEGDAMVGYKIVDDCPPLTTELEKNNMIGKTVVHGWDSNNATGWFVGTVHSRNLSASDLKKTPTANFVIKYTAKMTDGALNGKCCM